MGHMANGQRGIPVIDFGGLNDPAKRARICAEVAQASETVGIFELRNTGVRPETCNEAFAASREFFQLSDEEKIKCSKPGLEGIYKGVFPFQLGYKPSITTLGVKNRNERVTLRHLDSNADLNPPEEASPDPAADPTQNIWPETPKCYRQKVQNLFDELGKVADDLLDIFSESLGFSPNYLREVHDWRPELCRFVNMHSYPKGESDEGVEEIGIMPHRDISVFTLLTQFANVGGLEIKLGAEDLDWTAVTPPAGAILANIGDVLQIWTNGKYKSVLHRVMSNKTHDRYSGAYFLFPTAGPAEKEDFILKPIPALAKLDNGSGYGTITYLDFYMSRLKTSMSAPIKKELFEQRRPGSQA